MNLYDTKIRKVVPGDGSKSKYAGMLLAIYEYSQMGMRYLSNPVPAFSAQYMVDEIVKHPFAKRLLADIAKHDDFAKVEAFEPYDMDELKAWYGREWHQIMANQRVRDAWERFGSDTERFADGLGYTPRTIEKWITFRNLISDRTIIDAFRILEGEQDFNVFCARFWSFLRPVSHDDG